eukprot:g14677.t1
MPTAAAAHDRIADDVEAALPTTSGEDASPPVEIELEQEQEQEQEQEEQGQEDGGRASAARTFLNNRRRLTDFPFFALGFTSVVSLVFIISDLMNGHTFHPITAGVFLLSSGYCIAIIRRELSETEGASGAAGGTGQPGVLTKEARESLLTYFVFEGPMVEGVVAVAGSAEGQADQQPQEQEHGGADDEDPACAASTAGLVEEVSSSGGDGAGEWRQRKNGRSRKGGEENGRLDNGGSGSGMRDDRADTDATNADTDPLPRSTACTPAASTGPSSPAPSVTSEEIEQPRIEGGDGGGCGGGFGGSGGWGNAADSAAVAPVARIGVDQLDVEDQGVIRRIQGSSPLDGLSLGGLDVVAGDEASINSGASSAPRAVPGDRDNDGAGKATPETPQTTAELVEETAEEEEIATVTATAQAPSPAGDSMKGASASGSGSDSGEWSTDQSCIVCFGDYCRGDLLCRLPCRHVYHAKCIDEWLDRARTPCCPICKTDLLSGRTDDGNGNGNTAANGNGTSASVAGVAEVELTGDNAV